MLHRLFGGLALISSGGTPGFLVGALQVQAEPSADATWLWIGLAISLGVLVATGIGWLLTRPSETSRPTVSVSQAGQTNVSESNVGQIGDRISVQQAPRQATHVLMSGDQIRGLEATPAVRTEVFRVSFVCRGQYRSGTLKLEPQCPEHHLRLKARSNRYSKGELRDPSDDDWIGPVTSNSHLHCPHGEGHRVYFKGVEDGEAYTKMTQYQEARLMAEGKLQSELEKLTLSPERDDDDTGSTLTPSPELAPDTEGSQPPPVP